MAAVAFTVHELKNLMQHEGQHQQQHYEQPQQLRQLSSSASLSSSSEMYHLPQLQQQQQQQQQNNYVLMDQNFGAVQTPQQQNSYGSTTTMQQQQHQIQQLPKQELSIQELNPFPESVFSYTLFLASSLMVWVLYLLLPRGVRKQYFRANRKRYARRMDQGMPAAGYWMPVQSAKAQSTSTTPGFDENGSLMGSANGYISPIIAEAAARHKQQQQQQQQRQQQQQQLHHNPSYDTRDPPSSNPPSSPPRHAAGMLKTPPSPEHPALKKIPPNKIIAETMARLQGRGIRLVAHGVHCDPKRVWIRLQEDESNNSEPSVTWQTEFPRRVPDQNGNVSIVLMRGSLHSITLKNILYIDVGKKTHALQLARGVPESMCLSLLTQNGSLDLQANSKLERDSLVSCFSMILDDIHEEDWRALYEASPEPSLANSSTVFGSGGSLVGAGARLSYTLNSSRTPGTSGNFATPSPLHTSHNNNTKKAVSEEQDRMLQLL